MQYQARGDYRAIMPGQDALLHLTQQNAMDHSGGSVVRSFPYSRSFAELSSLSLYLSVCSDSRDLLAESSLSSPP